MVDIKTKNSTKKKANSGSNPATRNSSQSFEIASRSWVFWWALCDAFDTLTTILLLTNRLKTVILLGSECKSLALRSGINKHAIMFYKKACWKASC